MREWLTRLIDWFRRDKLDQELTEELRHHRSLLERDALSAGAAHDQARHAAARRLGSDLRAREASRDRWSWPWLDHLQQDVRYALRGLRRSPGFTAAVILTFGLGIGANAAMFGVIDRLMFRPLPYLRDPSRVHTVYLQSTDRERTQIYSWFEYTRYLDIRKWTHSFSQYAGYSVSDMAIGTGEASRVRHVARVSASFFDFFDARPVLGRFFGAVEDTTPVGAPVVVLGYGFWKSEFGGTDVLGQSLQVGNVLSTIIGVAPRGFVGVSDDTPPAVFMPITTYAGTVASAEDRAKYYTRYNWGWMQVLVRRKPGVRIDAASADLSAAHVMSWNAEMEQEPRMTPATIAKPAAIAGSVRPAAGPEAGLESKTALWVMGVAVIVLLIACANVTNLMLARVLRRRRETAVRLALGVSRWRLLRQALAECLVLALLGCAAGVVLAQWGGAVIRQLFVHPGTSLDVLTDWRTLAGASGFAVLAAFLTTLGAFILAPAEDLAGALKSGEREGGHYRSGARSALLVFQGALSVVLLVGAGLFVRSLNHVRQMRLGFEAENVLMVEPDFRGMQPTDSEKAGLGHRLLETAEAIPGVEHATWVSSIPFWSTSSTSLFVTGIDSVRRLGRFTYQSAMGDYFATMGTRVGRGRALTRDDRAGTPRVVVVSESMARALWPGKDALGQCLRVHADTMPCTTVVGIAEDAVQKSLGKDDKHLHYYLPMEQDEARQGFALLLKMRGDAGSQLEPVRRALQQVMPGLSYVRVQQFEDAVSEQRRSWQMGATMFAAFGGLALLVAAIGLYGAIAYNVAQRMHELGVRIALGARGQHVVRLVMEQGIRVALAGVVIGLALALFAARWIEPLLFEQPARDPVIYSLVGAVLVLVAIVASAVPAARAMRADPNQALRSD